MTWQEKIKKCYREGLQTTGGLYEEQEAIIEVVEALLKETEQRIAKEIISVIEQASVYSKNSQNIFTDVVMGVCKQFKSDIVEQLKKKYKGVE
jgi:DNA-binding ferritin-like protein (Dps family)